MKFSAGQLYFALFFALAFVLAMIWTYRKDLKVNRTNYKGVYKILLFIVALLSLLYAFVKIKTSH